MAEKHRFCHLNDEAQQIIEEERLKDLLHMAGASAGELNQPLAVLLRYIELLKSSRNDPKKLDEHIAAIEQAGQRITQIAQRIQGIRHCRVTPPDLESTPDAYPKTLKILYVEDSDADFEKVKNLLKNHRHIRLFRARGFQDAARALAKTQFDLIFSEYVFSDGNGLDVLQFHQRKGLETPVVIMTAHGDELIASQAIQNGATDYLPKRLVSENALSAAITNALEKYHLSRAVTMAQQKLAEMSTKDPLTGLYNRRYFMEALDREVARAGRYQSELVLCIVDVDHFKNVNDTYGHPTGDAVLTELGRMLREFIRESDLLCRYGGDEFAIILTSTDQHKAQIVCERFREMVAWHAFAHNAYRAHVTVSIGIASYSHRQRPTPRVLIEWADNALYRAKKDGRNRVVEYAKKAARHRPKLGKVLVSEGFVTDSQLSEALSEQQLKLGDILVRADRITAQQLAHALDAQKMVRKKLGEVLIEFGHATRQDIAWALKKMKRRLGEVMMDKGYIMPRDLQWALAMQSHEPRQWQ
ncbi:MAG: diguanylate cyclase [Deltaproteobacteria bacterium]|nr:diguanylate cyclase [Deltaproteobacteria bacterium]